MAVQTYETLFLLDSGKVSTDADAVRQSLHTTLERYGGEIVISRPWDDRKLAYPIEGQKKGAYQIVYYRIDSQKQADLERDFKLNEALLRHMTIKLDPKWAEPVLTVARDDHSPAFAVRGMQDETTPTTDPAALGLPPGEGEGGEGGGYRGRRGPRHEMAEKPE